MELESSVGKYGMRKFKFPTFGFFQLHFQTSFKPYNIHFSKIHLKASNVLIYLVVCKNWSVLNKTLWWLGLIKGNKQKFNFQLD